jgi:hypothetical protein
MGDIERLLGCVRSRVPHAVLAFGVAALAAGTLAACASGHGGADDGGLPLDADFDGEAAGPPPVAIETELPRNTIQAGDRVNARCVLLDEDGEPTNAPGANLVITYEPMTLFAQDGDGEVIGTTVGTATVRCAAPSLGLVDQTPEPLEIIPGAPHSVITQLSSDTTVAGTSTDVTCLAFDAFGNEVTTFDRTVVLSPSGAGVSVEGQSVTVTRSGLYEVSCNVSGAPELDSAFLFVSPGLPASIDVSLSPVRDVYVVNDEVVLRTDVRDQFGNRVDDADIAYTHPGVTMTSPGRFHFGVDGTFTLTATVTSETLTEDPLFASVQVIVNTSGPDIECLRVDNRTPSDAYMVNGVANSTVSLAVRVADTFGVDQVTIGGVTATPTTAGSDIYEANFPVRWGMNFARVVATDGGTDPKQNTRTCTFLASNHWVDEDGHLNDAVNLRLDQHAVDDGSSPSELTSLNNIMELALNSPALLSMVDQALLDSNPINSGGCGVWACEPDVHYNGGSLSWGYVTSTAQLISGGLRVQITIPNVRADVRACGTTCCIGGSNITVTMSSIVATVDFGLQLQGGQLRAGVLGDPNVSVNGVGLDGSGFCGFLIDLLEGTFASIVRDAVRDALGGFISSDLGPLIDDLVSSLDVSTIAPSFMVPRLDGSGDLAVEFGLNFSSLDISTSRLRLGLGTLFSVDGSSPTESLGVARRAGAVMLDPPGTSTARPVGLSLHEGVINQILHALWRGGFFHTSLDMGGTQVNIQARLPAVAHLDGGQVRLMLGAIRTEVTGLLPDPVWLTFGGTATASVTLSGDDLQFGDVELDDFFLNLDTSIESDSLETLEGLLKGILQEALGSAINDGLPAIPIPTFALPDEVAEFGLPAGAELGITDPQLNTTDHHYVLTGGFGVR